MNRTTRLRVVATVAAVVLGVALYSVTSGMFGGSEASITESASNTRPADFEYVIAPGTAARIESGASVEILPPVLTVHIGQTLRIINNDNRSHLIGPFSIAAGQTLTQTFVSVGTLDGACSIRPGNRFEIDVVA